MDLRRTPRFSCSVKAAPWESIAWVNGPWNRFHSVGSPLKSGNSSFIFGAEWDTVVGASGGGVAVLVNFRCLFSRNCWSRSMIFLWHVATSARMGSIWSTVMLRSRSLVILAKTWIRLEGPMFRVCKALSKSWWVESIVWLRVTATPEGPGCQGLMAERNTDFSRNLCVT